MARKLGTVPSFPWMASSNSFWSVLAVSWVTMLMRLMGIFSFNSGLMIIRSFFVLDGLEINLFHKKVE